MDEQTTTDPSTSTEPAAPATFADGAAQMQAAESAAAQPGAATTAQAATDPEAKASPSVSTEGPIPFSVHKTALDNARAKERAEVEQQYAWAKDLAGVPAHERGNLLAWYRTLQGDPSAAIEQVLATFASHPQHAGLLRTHAAKILAGARGQQPAEDPEPEPDAQSQDGMLFYSAAQMQKLREWNNRQLTTQLMKQFDEKLLPVQRVAHGVEQREAEATYRGATAQTIAALEAADPEFKAHKAEVWKTIDADPQLLELAMSDKTAAMAIKYAWSEVHRATVLPNLTSTARASVLASLNEKGTAGTLNPAHTNTSVSTHPSGRFTPEVVAAHFATAGL